MAQPRRQHLAIGDRLPPRSVVANNFAADSENRIHADDVAAAFGFGGALVPGVGVFAYMTQPVVEALGRSWLERGSMAARFVKPVYHGQRVNVQATVTGLSPLRFQVEVHNPAGACCAMGEALLPDEPLAAPDVAAYPQRTLPPRSDRLPARLDALRPGTVLGSLDFEAVWQTPLEGAQPFVDAVCDPLEIYRRQDDPACHPALVVAWANFLLAENVCLGPWVHTASAVEYLALPRQGDRLSLRGQVAESYTRRGHDLVELDLAMYDAAGRPLAHVRHTAIVRLALPE